MNPSYLNQSVVVFADPAEPGDGGVLGCRGIFIGIDNAKQRCAVEVSQSQRVLDVHFSDVFCVGELVGPSGVIAPGGMKASGAYRSRSGQVATFTFEMCECQAITFELRKKLEEAGTHYVRVNIRVPQTVVLTHGFIRSTLSQIFRGEAE